MSYKQTIHNEVAAHAAELIDLSRKVHANPEIGLHEHKACQWQVELLKKWGFAVEQPYGGLDTAYKAVAGTGSPVVCIMAEYDALPGLGHACGHNLICAAALGAGTALAAALREGKKAGTVIVMGTPAEEAEGGKVMLAAAGALAGVDVALMAHASDRTMGDAGRLAVVRRDVTFRGQASHAAAAPHLGRNALDAVMLFYAGINAWRQHLEEACRIHGVVTKGGDAPNIIPELAQCSFYLRADSDALIESMLKRFGAIAQGAALMTETTAEISEFGNPYKAGKINGPLNEEYLAAAAELGMEGRPVSKPNRASSDFGDVSGALPGAHVYFGVTTQKTPIHCPQFAAAACTDLAMTRMLLAAEAMARMGWRYCTDAEFRKNVNDDFDS